MPAQTTKSLLVIPPICMISPQNIHNFLKRYFLTVRTSPFYSSPQANRATPNRRPPSWCPAVCFRIEEEVSVLFLPKAKGQKERGDLHRHPLHPIVCLHTVISMRMAVSAYLLHRDTILLRQETVIFIPFNRKCVCMISTGLVHLTETIIKCLLSFDTQRWGSAPFAEMRLFKAITLFLTS